MHSFEITTVSSRTGRALAAPSFCDQVIMNFGCSPSLADALLFFARHGWRGWGKMAKKTSLL